jgi:hypothetical protein
MGDEGVKKKKRKREMRSCVRERERAYEVMG